MKKFLFLMLLSLDAFAGEKYLGTIAGTSGPTAKNNSSTATPFVIPSMAKITVQCDATAYVATDVVTATATNGVQVNSGTMLPTSVGSNALSVSSTPSAVVSVIGSSGAVNCKVFERRGNE